MGLSISGKSTSLFDIKSTVAYMSPEISQFKEEFDIKKLTHNPIKSDVYSLGLLIISFCKLLPFTDKAMPLDANVKAKIVYNYRKEIK